MAIPAIEGGAPVRTTPMPTRHLLTMAERDAVAALFDDALRTGVAFGYNGDRERAYEEEFAAFMGGGFADGVNSGTNAVYCALGALELEPFSEVICPAITDPGGIMPVALLGCIPVVADSAPGIYNASAETIEAMITPRTRAVIVAHIGGEAVDMGPVLKLAQRHGLRVVEDCAQAHGARCDGRLLGTFGDIAAFSTMSGKHHCTGAQGGVVYTRDASLAAAGRRFADRGKPFGLTTTDGTLGNVTAGLNCNSNDLAAAIGLVQIRRLSAILAGRIHAGNSIRQALRGNPVVRVGRQIPNSQPSYWFLRMTVSPEAMSISKARFCEALSAEGIPVVPAYRAIPAECPWFTQKRVLGRPGFPWDCADYAGPKEPRARIANALAAVAVNFNIPMHESYGEREIEDIVAALDKVSKAYAR